MQRHVPARTAEDMERQAGTLAVRARGQPPPVRLNRVEDADPGVRIRGDDLFHGQLAS